VVVTFSGCPGGSPTNRTPNWITAAWPHEYAESRPSIIDAHFMRPSSARVRLFLYGSN
jgi:hypothetical protein